MATRRDLEKIMSAMAHLGRQEIMRLLGNGPIGELTSQQILSILRIPKANLSQNLTVLENAGLIIRQRGGRYARVKITPRGLFVWRSFWKLSIWLEVEW